MTVDQSLLRKIKKLLALAGSPNAHEAAAALNKARSLMDGHGLTEAAVDLASVERSNPYRIRSSAKAVPDWVWHLMHLAGGAFGVKPLMNKVTSRLGGKVVGRENRVTFIGAADRVELAAYAFAVLYRQLLRARADILEATRALKKRSERIKKADWFCAGWVDGVAKVLRKFEMSAAEEAVLQAWVEARDLKEAETREVKADPFAAAYYRAGQKEGREARLYRPMGGRGSGPAAIAWPG